MQIDAVSFKHIAQVLDNAEAALISLITVALMIDHTHTRIHTRTHTHHFTYWQQHFQFSFIHFYLLFTVLAKYHGLKLVQLFSYSFNV